MLAFENVLLTIGLELLDLAASDLVNRFVELAHDVEAIKNVQRLWCLFGDDLQVRSLHIAAEELEFGTSFRAELLEELQQRLGLAFRTAPDQPPGTGVNLIHQRQILVPFENGNLVNADLSNALKASVGKTVIDDEHNGPEDRISTGLKNSGCLLPGQSLRPTGKKDLVRNGRSFLAVGPGQSLNLDAMLRTFDSAWRVAEKGLKRPDR